MFKKLGELEEEIEELIVIYFLMMMTSLLRETTLLLTKLNPIPFWHSIKNYRRILKLKKPKQKTP